MRHVPETFTRGVKLRLVSHVLASAALAALPAIASAADADGAVAALTANAAGPASADGAVTLTGSSAAGEVPLMLDASGAGAASDPDSTDTGESVARASVATFVAADSAPEVAAGGFVPAFIPEPASLSLLGLTAAACFRRTRRRAA